MASAWGKSWSTFWGNSWGRILNGGSRSLTKKKRESIYVPIRWDIDWQQPVIAKVERVLPEDIVVALKAPRDLYRPTIYLNKLLDHLRLLSTEVEGSITSLDEADKKISLLEVYSKLEYKLETLINKQKRSEEKQEEEEIQLLLIIGQKYFFGY